MSTRILNGDEWRFLAKSVKHTNKGLISKLISSKLFNDQDEETKGLVLKKLLHGNISGRIRLILRRVLISKQINDYYKREIARKVFEGQVSDVLSLIINKLKYNKDIEIASEEFVRSNKRPLVCHFRYSHISIEKFVLFLEVIFKTLESKNCRPLLINEVPYIYKPRHFLEYFKHRVENIEKYNYKQIIFIVSLLTLLNEDYKCEFSSANSTIRKICDIFNNVKTKNAHNEAILILFNDTMYDFLDSLPLRKLSCLKYINSDRLIDLFNSDISHSFTVRIIKELFRRKCIKEVANCLDALYESGKDTYLREMISNERFVKNKLYPKIVEHSSCFTNMFLVIHTTDYKRYINTISKHYSGRTLKFLIENAVRYTGRIMLDQFPKKIQQKLIKVLDIETLLKLTPSPNQVLTHLKKTKGIDYNTLSLIMSALYNAHRKNKLTQECMIEVLNKTLKLLQRTIREGYSDANHYIPIIREDFSSLYVDVNFKKRYMNNLAKYIAKYGDDYCISDTIRRLLTQVDDISLEACRTLLRELKSIGENTHRYICEKIIERYGYPELIYLALKKVLDIRLIVLAFLYHRTIEDRKECIKVLKRRFSRENAFLDVLDYSAVHVPMKSIFHVTHDYSYDKECRLIMHDLVTHAIKKCNTRLTVSNFEILMHLECLTVEELLDIAKNKMNIKDLPYVIRLLAENYPIEFSNAKNKKTILDNVDIGNESIAIIKDTSKQIRLIEV